MFAKVAEKVINTKMAFTWYTKCAIVNVLKTKEQFQQHHEGKSNYFK